MNRIFVVDSRHGRIMINPKGIKAVIVANDKKKEEKKSFRTLKKSK